MENKKKYTDLELIDLLRAGSEIAFAEIYNRYKAALFLHAYRMLKNDEEARDLVQEMFAVLWSKREQLVVKGNLDSYLYGAIKNRILNFIAHQKVIDKYTLTLEYVDEASERSGDELMIENELRRLIEREIAELPGKMRMIFELSRMDGLSHRQIAEKLNISENTVKSQIQNATKILRPKMRANIIFLLIF